MSGSSVVPAYLADPIQAPGRRVGTLRVEMRPGRHTNAHTIGDARPTYILHAEPAALEFAKRLFPGSVTHNLGTLTFPVTTRATGDLNWFLLRFPLELDAEAAATFLTEREAAIAHALRREAHTVVPPASPPATFTGALLPFQAEDVARAIAERRTLLTWPMGSGKTVGATAALATAQAFPALIVVPPNLTRQWNAVLPAFLNLGEEPAQLALDLQAPPRAAGPRAPAHRMCHLIRGLKPYPLPDAPIHIIHYGLLRGWKRVLPSYGYRAVIFDEIQELRHTGTEKYSAASLVAERAEFVWGLSGTPIYNYGAEMWAVVNILEFLALGSFDAFTREWCTGYGNKVVRDPVALGDHLRREGLMIRRTDAEVLAHLPPARHVTQVIGKDDAVYGKLVAEAVKLASRYDGITDWAERGRAMREIDTISRRATGIAKAPEAAAFIRGLAEAGERVLVFAHHHDVHDIICETLADLKPARVTGVENQAQKDEAIRRFVEGETPIIELALRSTAGLDGLQGRGSVVVFVELDWSPAVHAQCAARLRRMGVSLELESILCYYLVCDSGSDETQMEALGLKVSQFVGLVGEKPETEDDRLLASTAADRHLGRVIEALRQLDPDRKVAA